MHATSPSRARPGAVTQTGVGFRQSTCETPLRNVPCSIPLIPPFQRGLARPQSSRILIRQLFAAAQQAVRPGTSAQNGLLRHDDLPEPLPALALQNPKTAAHSETPQSFPHFTAVASAL